MQQSGSSAMSYAHPRVEHAKSLRILLVSGGELAQGEVLGRELGRLHDDPQRLPSAKEARRGQQAMSTGGTLWCQGLRTP